MEQAELAQQLRDTQQELVKIQTETQSLIDKVGELETALQNADDVTPELQAAAQAVIDQTKVVDDLVPDQPPPPPVNN